MLSGGVPTSLWYPSLPDRGWFVPGGAPSRFVRSGRGPKRELCALVGSAVFKKNHSYFLYHRSGRLSAQMSLAIFKNFSVIFFFGFNRVVICAISMSTMVEEWMVYSG